MSFMQTFSHNATSLRRPLKAKEAEITMSPVSDKTTVEQLEEMSAKGLADVTVPGNASEAYFRMRLAEWFRSGGAELVRDGLRYRWLREHSTRPVETWSTHDNPESLDAAIDAARKEKP